MFCRYCGKVIPNDSIFCPSCGVKLENVTSNNKIEDSYADNIALPEVETSIEEDILIELKNEELPLSRKRQSVNSLEKDSAITDGADVDVPHADISCEILESNDSPEEQDVVRPEISKMPLIRRFFGSIIDKFLILAIFFVGPIAIDYYGAPSKLGAYVGLFSASPRNYEYIDKSAMSDYGNYKEGISQYYQDQERLANEPPHIGSTMELDKSMTTFFILLNLLYYIIFESLLSASLGKRITGGVILDALDEKIGFGKVLQRALCGGILMFSLVYLIHFEMMLSYKTVFILFFLLMDLPVLFTKRSLLDILTGTTYAKR